MPTLREPEYGVKLPITAVVNWGGCFACEIEGYVLSQIDYPEAMDVTLIRCDIDPLKGIRKHGTDRPGPSLGAASNNHSDLDAQFLYRHLWRAAQEQHVKLELEAAWHEWAAWNKLGDRADAYHDREIERELRQ